MRVLVTGGAGFIGSHLVDGFIADGHEVLVLDNLSSGRREQVNNRAELAVVDLLDFDATDATIASFRPDIVDHHAAQIDVRKSVADPAFDAQVNVLGSVNLLSSALRHGVRGVVFASSGGTVYGETPIPAREDDAKAPISPYGAAKHSVEGYLFSFAAAGLPSVALRYGNVYGPRQDPRGEAGVISIFAGAMLHAETPTIFGSGNATRDYVMVSDVVAANRRAIEALLSGREAPSVDDAAFNIGTGISTSVNDLYDLIARVSGFERPAIRGPERPGELQESQLNIGKARELLAFAPRISLSDGIDATVHWLREARSDSDTSSDGS